MTKTAEHRRSQTVKPARSATQLAPGSRYTHTEWRSNLTLAPTSEYSTAFRWGKWEGGFWGGERGAFVWEVGRFWTLEHSIPLGRGRGFSWRRG